MLLGVSLYFFLVVAVLALVCLPEVRERALSGAANWWRRGVEAGSAWRAVCVRRASHHGELARSVTWRMASGMRRHAVPTLAAFSLIVAMPLTAALLRGAFRVDSFDPSASRLVDEHVAELLKGEQLVSPPPLPPELFTSREVEEWQPMARSASRQWDLLDESFRQRLLLAFKILHDQYGYEMVLVEGYRSPQRQASLAALGPTVTRAGPFESYHQFGLAADCAFMRDGRIVISEKDPWTRAAYERYGQVAKSLGLVWGGDWQKLRDLGHVELRKPHVLSTGGDNRNAQPTLSR
jgi:peptidoglycan L-alanyl-D-glutamate endopeptidase CwlK